MIDQAVEQYGGVLAYVVIVAIPIQVAAGFACVYVARRKGVLHIGWVLAAALVGLPALVAVLLKDKSDK